jgi:hypothetical protein
MTLEEYEELYPKTEMEPNSLVDSQYEYVIRIGSGT